MKKRTSWVKWLVIAMLTFILLAVIAVVALIQVLDAAKTTLPAPSTEQHEREAFIGQIGEVAREVASEHGLYASVMIAQASLESHFGTSGLASAPNYNLYGIKGAYNGKSVKMETEEDDGKGNMKTIKAHFRQYPDYQASLENYADLLAKGTSWDKNFYSGTFKMNAASYEEATAALTGSYASDSSYEHKLNELIEQYHLTAYDDAYATKQIVTAGLFDNIEDISATYNIPASLIRQWNNLKTNELKKDQQITLYVSNN